MQTFPLETWKFFRLCWDVRQKSDNFFVLGGIEAKTRTSFHCKKISKKNLEIDKIKRKKTKQKRKKVNFAKSEKHKKNLQKNVCAPPPVLGPNEMP